MSTQFDAAAQEYRRRTEEHECTGDEDCPLGSSFYLISWIDDEGTLCIASGGHRIDPASLVEAAVKVVDEIHLKDKDLSPLEAFMTSRDIFHTAADSVETPPDVAQALSEFVSKSDSDD